jgi:hypothetical protein
MEAAGCSEKTYTVIKLHHVTSKDLTVNLHGCGNLKQHSAIGSRIKFRESVLQEIIK